MLALGIDVNLLLHDLARVLVAFVLALPIGWERGKGSDSVGFRTLPVVAMAACGFALLIDGTADADVEARARVLQGVIAGIGFIGGGAIVKQETNVSGLVTAASIWNAGAIGVAVGFGRGNIAIVLRAVNLASLVVLGHFANTHTSNEDE